jgi:hypothetical protein
MEFGSAPSSNRNKIFQRKARLSPRTKNKVKIQLLLLLLLLLLLESQFFIKKICDCQQQVKLLSGVQHTELLSSSVHRSVSVGNI